MKTTLATQLRKRTETIEFRAIKKQLMVIAQNKGTQYLSMFITPETMNMLQNEGLTVEKFTEYGYEKYKITW